jgi:hypothetical protein
MMFIFFTFYFKTVLFTVTRTYTTYTASLRNKVRLNIPMHAFHHIFMFQSSYDVYIF